MTVDEIRATCAKARAQGLDYLIVVVTRKTNRTRRSQRMRLWPGVMGSVVGQRAPGEWIVSVKVEAVEASLDRLS